MHTYGKALATIEEASDDGPGGFTAVLSTESLDRDGDRLMRDEWADLPDKITLDVDHGMSVEATIGSARPYFDDDGRLMMDATFASTPKAQEVRSLVREGHVSSVSVAFMNDKTNKDSKPRRELLNAGIVAIPANKEAVILAAKSLSDVKEALSGGIMSTAEVKAVLDLEAEDVSSDEKSVDEVDTKAGARNSTADSAMIQAIHDASVHLGAGCVQETMDSGSGADDGANKSVTKAKCDDDEDDDDKDDDDDDEKKSITVQVVPDFTTFNEQLNALLSGQRIDIETSNREVEETPSDSPAESPAPADEAAAADEAAEDVAFVMQPEHMALIAFAQSELLSDSD